jgi:hypothetical protein
MTQPPDAGYPPPGGYDPYAPPPPPAHPYAPPPPPANPYAAAPPMANPYVAQGGAYAAGYGQPPVATVPTGINPFAIVSLVLSLCGGGLLGLIFGIVALVQTKRTGQRGRGMAIAGVVISSLYFVAIAVIVVIGVTTSASRNASGQIDDPGSISLTSLKVGDCIEQVPSGVTTGVDAVPCSKPHHAEVFAVFNLFGNTYPGDEAVATLSNNGCASRLKGYSASAAADDAIDIYYFAPTRSSWSNDKSVICLASDDTHLRTGSIKG